MQKLFRVVGTVSVLCAMVWVFLAYHQSTGLAVAGASMLAFVHTVGGIYLLLGTRPAR